MNLLTRKKFKNTVKFSTATSLTVLLTACNIFTPEPSKTHIGTDGDDVMTGTNGLDTFKSSPGADRIDGLYEGLFFEKPDVVDYSGSNAGVTVYLNGSAGKGGHAEGDVLLNIHDLIGSDFNDVLEGNDKNNKLDGGAGDDILRGGGAQDILIGGAGADVLDGGSGVDIADYSTSTAAVTVNLTANSGIGGDAQGDTFASVEYITGSNYDDVLTGDAADNLIVGGKGADKIDGAAGDDSVSYKASNSKVIVDLALKTGVGGDAQGDVLYSIENVYGSQYNDIINGDVAANYISGENGDDIISGEGGNDTLTGDAGDDILNGNDGNDSLNGGTGNNQLNGGAGFDVADITQSSDAALGFSIQKFSNKIVVISSIATDSIHSVEQLAMGTKTIDIKNIYSDLSLADQLQFNGEADFLSWLGNGYNYEGL
uniref:Calcium-binding protein n=1 Tax=OCS116 cluster bacterium TaxID=2030921 RepID=A0A2A4YYM0_9PROT